MTIGRSDTYRNLAGVPYALLRSGNVWGMIPYLVCSRLYHSYRAIVRRDSSLFFGAERAVEVRWVFGHLRKMSPGLLLEVGDVLGPELARTGFRVETVDLHARSLPPAPNWRVLAQDARLLDSAAAYDVAVSISTLEHIGMGHYGDEIDSAGDRRCVTAVLKALKPGGSFLVTVPLSRGQKSSWQRLYTLNQINRLFSSFEMRELQVFTFRWIAWKRVSWSAETTPRTFGPVEPEVTSIACVLAKSPETVR